MNKKLFLIVLLFPLIINAKECNESKHQEYINLSPNITYDNNYSKSSSSFNIVIYNIFDEMYVKYNNRTYKPDNENKVTIENIKEGSNVNIDIYADDGCSQIKAINLLEPYYNSYYDSSECNGYKDKIAVCSSQFTSSKVSSELVSEAKKNYDNAKYQNVENETEEEDNSFLKTLVSFIRDWGIKIALVVITIFVSSSIYNAKFRKIKHGI